MARRPHKYHYRPGHLTIPITESQNPRVFCISRRRESGHPNANAISRSDPADTRTRSSPPCTQFLRRRVVVVVPPRALVLAQFLAPRGGSKNLLRHRQRSNGYTDSDRHLVNGRSHSFIRLPQHERVNDVGLPRTVWIPRRLRPSSTAAAISAEPIPSSGLRVPPAAWWLRISTTSPAPAAIWICAAFSSTLWRVQWRTAEPTLCATCHAHRPLQLVCEWQPTSSRAASTDTAILRVRCSSALCLPILQLFRAAKGAPDRHQLLWPERAAPGMYQRRKEHVRLPESGVWLPAR